MFHLDSDVLIDLDHERLQRQSAALERRLRRIADDTGAAGSASPGRIAWLRWLMNGAEDEAAEKDEAIAEFAGFSCGTERMLVGSIPHTETIMLARALVQDATARDDARAVAFGHSLLGQAAFLAGYLHLAARELSIAAERQHSVDSVDGEAHALIQLARVRIAEGRPDAARLLLEHARPLAEATPASRHLLPRLWAALIASTTDSGEAWELADRAANSMGSGLCATCHLTFVLAALTACADAGDLHGARHYADQVWRSSRLWAGAVTEGAVSEALAHLAMVAGSDPITHLDAETHLDLALGAYDAAGQPLDVARIQDLRAHVYTASGAA